MGATKPLSTGSGPNGFGTDGCQPLAMQAFYSLPCCLSSLLRTPRIINRIQPHEPRDPLSLCALKLASRHLEI